MTEGMSPTSQAYAAIVLSLLMSSALSQAQSANTCDRGWFGSRCQFKCHCRGIDVCDVNGTCPEDICDRGWFGPACQYMDLVVTNSSQDKLDWLFDDRKCNFNPIISINLTAVFPFTWLRLQVRYPSLLKQFELKFTSTNETSYNCEKMRTAVVNDRTLDIHCELDVSIQAVTLTGEGVGSLCSLYISGGRNVALRQNTSQSSTYSADSDNKLKNKTAEAKNAVDGNRDQEFYNGSCTHTNQTSDKNPTWHVSLSQKQIINRYVLYNRNNNRERLKGFTLKSFTMEEQIVFNYEDNQDQDQYSYIINSEKTETLVSKVSIQVHHRDGSRVILTLCEVELYGDSSCPPSMYGRECEHACNCAVENDSCFVSTGGCPSGCASGFQGESCHKPCEAGKYGEGCGYNCSQFCVNNSSTSCHHVTGTCLFGCLSGYRGLKCEQVVMEDQPAGVVVGTLIAVAGIIMLVLGIIFWRRHTNAKHKNIFTTETRNEDENSLQGESEAVIDSANTSRRIDNESNNDHRSNLLPKEKTKTIKIHAENRNKEDTVYCNTTTSKTISTSIAVDDLCTFMESHDKTFFQNQFNTIPNNTNATMDVGTSEENKAKNRYKNILAYDHSRVELNVDKKKKLGGYINASYINGYKMLKEFIASQGPTKVMIEDFVRMLSEQDVQVVVMLTNLTEDGKKKCEQYWPEENEMKIGQITVKLARSQVFADYTIRTLQLVQDGRPAQTLTQFHFTSWPDKDVPTTAWSLVDFEQRVSTISTDKPVIVHCSAGVGRTGTFIALHNVIRQAVDTGYMDFFSTVQKLRQDRMLMVQTANQYEFLHMAALVAIICMGTAITSTNISSRIKILNNTRKHNKTQMELEFESVCSACHDIETHIDQDMEQYTNANVGSRLKNRFPDVLSREDSRVILAGSGDDYINAVFMPSFSMKNQNILTQLPLPTTLTDFWRMVTQYKVTTVVAFEVDFYTDSTIAYYFPTDEDDEISVPPFKIKAVEIYSRPLWNEHKLTVTTNSQLSTASRFTSPQKEHNLTHITCSDVLNTENLEDTLSLMKTVRLSSSGGNDGRTVFMCKNGANYSGFICALSLLLSRLDNNCVSVPLVVGAMKAIRPQVIPTVHQYNLLYQLLKLYTDANNVYSNFG